MDGWGDWRGWQGGGWAKEIWGVRDGGIWQKVMEEECEMKREKNGHGREK